MPRCLETVGSVRASTKIQLARVANDVQIFCPSITHSSPSSAARVLRPARSEPAFGSENPWHHVSSPERMRGRNRCFCSSVPHFRSVLPTIFTETVSLAGPSGTIARGTLLHQDDLFELAPPAAAVLRRPRQAEQPVLVQGPPPARHECGRVVSRERADSRPVGGEVLGEEAADLRAERLGLGSGAEVHGRRISEKLTDASSIGHARRAPVSTKGQTPMYDMPEELLVEADGPIRIITMNNPEMRNAFIDPLHEAMRNIWYEISRDRDARAVVLTGAGSAFCAGGNVPGFVRDYDDPEHRRQSLRDAQRLVDEMLRFHLPVVAAINGPAVGLGASVAVSCDIVLIAESAYIADTHVNIGLTAGDGGAATWPLLIGMLRAKEYLLTGERIPAKLAVEIGLANRLVADDQLMEEATALAHKLAALPPQSVQETKRALNLHLQQAATTVLPFALSAEAESFATPEIKATIEKFSK